MSEDASSQRPHPTDGVPGCGLASYGLLLMFFCLLGITGMILSSLSLLQAGGGTGPTRLVPGNQVAVWRLQPMRSAGLLELTEIPAAWHDETLTGDGTVACGLTDEAVLRVEAPQGWSIPYANITRVSLHERERHVTVEINSDRGETLRCFFGPGEDAEKMLRMVQSEAGL